MVDEPLIRSRVLRGVLLLVLLASASPVGAQSDSLQRIESMYREYERDSFPGVPAVSAVAARAWADSVDVVFVDARAPRERKISELPDALSTAEFEQTADRYTGRPVIVYCTIGYRSGIETVALRRRGIEAYNLEGGILAWAHAEGNVVDGVSGVPTRRVHVYGRRWNLLPAGWTGVW